MINRTANVEVVVEPDGHGFHAYCPALKGLHTCGDTEEETLQNAKDAAIAYLFSLIKHGDPIPDGLCPDCARETTEDYLKELKSYIDDLDSEDKEDILREFPHLAKN